MRYLIHFKREIETESVCPGAELKIELNLPQFNAWHHLFFPRTHLKWLPSISGCKPKANNKLPLTDILRKKPPKHLCSTSPFPFLIILMILIACYVDEGEMKMLNQKGLQTWTKTQLTEKCVKGFIEEPHITCSQRQMPIRELLNQ